MWNRSAHRAHGLDTYVCKFTYLFFGNINFIARLCDFLVLPHPVYHVHVSVLKGDKIYPNR